MALHIVGDSRFPSNSVLELLEEKNWHFTMAISKKVYSYVYNLLTRDLRSNEWRAAQKNNFLYFIFNDPKLLESKKTKKRNNGKL